MIPPFLPYNHKSRLTRTTYFNGNDHFGLPVKLRFVYSQLFRFRGGKVEGHGTGKGYRGKRKTNIRSSRCYLRRVESQINSGRFSKKSPTAVIGDLL